MEISKPPLLSMPHLLSGMLCKWINWPGGLNECLLLSFKGRCFIYVFDLNNEKHAKTEILRVTGNALGSESPMGSIDVFVDFEIEVAMGTLSLCLEF